MPVKIRLQRHGKKGKPFYWVVAADSRSKRDGKYLEKIGTYNPNQNPALIDLNVDTAVKWLQNGAQPTDTAKTILSEKGVLLKNHLQIGVNKGAITAEQAEEKFQAWATEKDARVNATKDGLAKTEGEVKAAAFAAEKAVNEKRRTVAAEAIAAQEAEAAAVVAAQEAEAAAAAAPAEEASEEAAPEENAAE